MHIVDFVSCISDSAMYLDAFAKAPVASQLGWTGSTVRNSTNWATFSLLDFSKLDHVSQFVRMWKPRRGLDRCCSLVWLVHVNPDSLGCHHIQDTTCC